ncbi:Zinc finger protein PLAG1 [Mizuhopecten yessoensis]|uniref:Zinc finger protein PLAG1 n=1 Tax=Mizuhopecten yessoensis TaxID=6573 RepID=A0A210QCA7_MIZYE|nr:Zinc finger protein PLAG1 [Mizuhopecten yessoensis]
MSSKKDDFWCSECSKSVPGMCRKHGGFHQVYDNVIPSRARLTLPQGLVIKPVKTQDGKLRYGVLAKRIVQVKSQFGPFMAKVVSTEKAKPKKEKTEQEEKKSKEKEITSNEEVVTELSRASLEQKVETPISLPAEMTPLESQQNFDTGTVVGHKVLVDGDLFEGIVSDNQSNQQIVQVGVSSSQTLQAGSFSDAEVTQSLQCYLSTANSLTDVANALPSFNSGGDMLANQTQYGSELNLQTSIEAGLPVTDGLSSNAGLSQSAEQQLTQIPNQSFETRVTVDSEGRVVVVPVNTLHGLVSTQMLVNDSLTLGPTQNQLTEGLTVTATGDSLLVNPATGEVLSGPHRTNTNSIPGLIQQQSSELMPHQASELLQHQSGELLQQNPADELLPQHQSTQLISQQSGEMVLQPDDMMLQQQPAEVGPDGDNTKELQASQTEGDQTKTQDSTGKQADTAEVPPIIVNTAAEQEYELKVFREDGYVDTLDFTDEDKCNWMMFIRPAKTASEQNLVAYQFQDYIFYVSTKPIPSNTELKVWYSADYAEKMGKDMLPDDESPEGAEFPAKWVCSVCFEGFSTFAELEAHMCPGVPPGGKRLRGRPRKGRPRKYVKPSKTWRARLDKARLSKARVQDPMVPNVPRKRGIKPFICEDEDCKKGFMSKFKLERHRLIHTCPRHHKCPYCDKSFNRKDHLKNHLITHDPNKKRWVCEECGKEYSYNFSYRTHKAFHDAESGRTTECGICHKEHETREELLYHLKVHSGARSVKNCLEKTHECIDCCKKFYTKKDVRRHMITHTKKKDFLCQHCPQRFGRKDHLTRHLRSSHSGDNPNAKPPRAPRGEKKERQVKHYERIEQAVAMPTMREEPAVLVTSQPSLNNPYPIHAIPTENRDVPLPIHLYENINAQPVITMATMTQQQQQQPAQMQQTLHIAPANQMQVERYTVEVGNQGIRHVNVNQTMDAGVIGGNDYRTMQHQGTTMYLAQPQQHHMIANKDANMELVRTNGVLDQVQYQPVREQGTRPTVLQTSDARQTPSAQTFSTLLGYMETLRFLENLPTNTQGGVIQMETTHTPTMVPIQTMPYSTSATPNLVAHPTEMQKRMPVSHHNVYQQGS